MLLKQHLLNKSYNNCIQACLDAKQKCEGILDLSNSYKKQIPEQKIQKIIDCIDVCSLTASMLKRNSLNSHSILLNCTETCVNCIKTLDYYFKPQSAEAVEVCYICIRECGRLVDLLEDEIESAA